MTFKVPLLHRSTTVSDEGFKVTFLTRGTLRYQFRDLSIILDIDVGDRYLTIDHSSLQKKNAEKSRQLSADQEMRIFCNIIDALTWRGWTVDVVTSM
jgi:hypothetical protein